MKNIRYFSSVEEWEHFLKEVCVRFIDNGSEGDIYQTKDNKAIKVITCTDNCINPISNFNYILEYEKIITADLVPSSYFLFPEELYVVGKQLCGYKTKLVKKDFFKYLLEPAQYLNLDLWKLENAFIRFQLELERLSDLGVFIYDLPTNIMYDGSQIYAIDTCYNTFDEYAKYKNQKTFEITFMATFEPLLLGILDSNQIGKMEFNNIRDYLAQIKSYCIDYVNENKENEEDKEDDYDFKQRVMKYPTIF